MGDFVDRSEYYFYNWLLYHYGDSLNDDDIKDIMNCFNNNRHDKCFDCKYFPYNSVNDSDNMILKRNLRYFQYHKCKPFEIMQEYYKIMIGG